MLTVPQQQYLSVHQQQCGEYATHKQPVTPTEVVDMWKDYRELFQKRVIKIDSDSVGYGFVLRGEGPAYVQTVDPSGPAAKSGLKVGHIVQTVNGVDVSACSHKEAAKVILGRRLSNVVLVVQEVSSAKSP